MIQQKQLLRLNELSSNLNAIDGEWSTPPPIFYIDEDILYFDYIYLNEEYYRKIERDINYAKNVLNWCSIWIQKYFTYFNTMSLKYYQYDDFTFKDLEIEI